MGVVPLGQVSYRVDVLIQEMCFNHGENLITIISMFFVNLKRIIFNRKLNQFELMVSEVHLLTIRMWLWKCRTNA